ncbi:DNA polymerase III subunit alpha [Candidatus Hodgkinia cicadicola]|uniref:DNA polymerase III subunit alpha n=1 Tax=Candidatus Hodgkinia cicadicola TaxID=573658 RepID=A0ABX4MJC6_9HYPH|nr:DNA polymerase III subunit alpha [Candidatus Hodgkinia cicadicola]
MINFVNLKVHSIYSILESTLKVDRIAELAFEKKQKAVCLTDNNLHGSLEFCLKCIELGIKPIIGCKLAINHKHTLFSYGKRKKSNLIITVLIQSELGYKNLLKLINQSDCKHNYHVVNLKDIHSLSKGLICLMGGFGSLSWDVYNTIGPNKTIDRLNVIKNIFDNNLCIELERNIFTNPDYEKFMIDYAKTNGLVVAAINETYFESPEDIEVIEILQSISKQKLTHISKNNYFNDYKNILTRFPDVIEAVKNTTTISNLCNFHLEKRIVHLPSILKNKKTENKILYLKSIEALEYMFYSVGKKNKEIYYDRLLKELSIILVTSYSGYFLIVSDFTLWAKYNNIYVGSGRGSASGSLIAYCLGITVVDPMVHELLFERFLNVNRISLPDIDVDFCHEGREKIIRYIQLKYGIRNIGQIITFGSLQVKVAIKDVGRYLSISYNTLNLLCKSLPTFDHETNSILDVLYKTKLISSPLFEKVMNIILKLIGLYRQISTHAAGLVIYDTPLVNDTPIVWSKEDRVGVVQHSMNWVDSAGLPKFDLLGLKTLTAIDETIEYITINRIHIDLECYTDNKTFELICNGTVLGTFQLESQGMKEHIKHIRPSSIIDLTALIALYRPGPIKHIKLYSDAKWKRTKRTSLHKSIDYILDETYGIIIYQEQVMLIAQELAGYSLSEADVLRRVMAKKDRKEMSEQRTRFVNGVVANKIDHNLAREIFDTLLRFADYGFNKSHAVAYSSLAYLTSYLKANFPLEFYVANMNTEIMDLERVSALYYDAIDMGIKFLLPSVCLPVDKFIIGNNLIYFPLSVIKGLNDQIIDSINKSMNNKKFKNLLDFCIRSDAKIITKTVLKSLIYSGALDCFNISRKQLVSLINTIIICLTSKHDPNNLLGNYTSNNNEEIPLALLYKEYLMLNCYVSKCSIIEIDEGSKPNLKGLCIVVSHNKDIATVIIGNKRLNVLFKSKKRIELGNVYRYTFEKIAGKLCCISFVLFKFKRNKSLISIKL